MIFRSFLLPGISRKRKLSRSLKLKERQLYLCWKTGCRQMFLKNF